MQFFLISDNNDTTMGLRMAGIEGVHADTPQQVIAALKQAIADPTIAIVLISAKLMERCRDEIYAIKKKQSQPLIVEVTDRHGQGNLGSSISRYVKDAIGIQL